MKLFCQTRSYYSSYSLKDLTDILKYSTIGSKHFEHRLMEETEEGYLLKPIGYHVRNVFAPAVTVSLQEDQEKTQVNLSFRLLRRGKILLYIYIAVVSLIVAAFLYGSFPDMIKDPMLVLVIPLLYATPFAFIGICFQCSSWSYRRTFIKQLKLYKLDNRPKGESI